jgi:oligoribonuclease
MAKRILVAGRRFLFYKKLRYTTYMADLKHTTPKTILWLDLEMTGLNPQEDCIVEVAAIVTDWDFTELEVYETGVRQSETELKRLFGRNPFAQSRPTETQQLIELSLNAPSESEVENRLMQLIDAHRSQSEVVLLAGNSIHADRGFIRRYWPQLESRLHYRMLDVSAWKVVMQAKYGLEFQKQESHRALQDTRESIAELQYYLAQLQPPVS